MQAHTKRLRLPAIAKCCAVLCESSESLWRAFQFPPPVPQGAEYGGLCRRRHNARAECRAAPGAFSTADAVRLAVGNRFLRPTVLRRVSCVCGRCGAAKRALYPRCRLRRKYAPHLCVCCMRHKRRNGFLAAFGLGGCARIFGAALLFPSRCFRAKNANWKAQSQHAALYIQTGRRFCFALSGGRVCRAEAAAVNQGGAAA